MAGQRSFISRRNRQVLVDRVALTSVWRMPYLGSFFFGWGGGLGRAVTSPVGGLGGFGDGLTGISWSVLDEWTNGRGEKGGVVSERWQIGGREGGAPQ